MKILVTDGKGFIGKNFIELYGKKYDIVSVSYSDSDLTRYEEVANLFKSNKFDAVLHCGAYGDVLIKNKDYSDCLATFKNIQYAAILGGVKKLLVISDASDTDLSKPLIDCREDKFAASEEPAYGYDIGKYLMNVLAGKDKISTVLRVFGAYGKFANTDKNCAAEILSHAVVGKKQISLKGDKTFSAVYAEDLCKIISKFLDNDYERGTYNIASPLPVTLSEFARKAKNFAKKNGREITVTVADKEENELTANTDKLLSTIGQFKFTAHATAINKTLEYYAAHKSALKAGGGK